MPAIVTDQFRILNASNFVAGVSSSTNSYYISLGLPNPAPASVGFGRANNFDTATPNPVDSFSDIAHIGDLVLRNCFIFSINFFNIFVKFINV